MTEAWWGEFNFEIGAELHWRVGPLDLWVLRGETEWRVAYEIANEALDASLEIASPRETAASGEPTVARFGVRATTSQLTLRPVCADRPFIVKSELPFYVPPHEESTVFVSTPVWVQLFIERQSEPLTEIPSYRPSDSWFGPSNLIGELCYAARTGARLSLDNVPLRPNRAVSVVRLRNQADTALGFERIRMPLPNMTLYASKENHLWTEKLTLERVEDSELAKLSLTKQAPEQAEAAHKLSSPRIKVEKGLLQRSFGGLLGLRGAHRNE